MKRWWAITLLISSLVLAGGRSATARDAKGPRMQVVILGTGTPNADPGRSGPSVAVIVDDTPYIVDFGPGVVRRAAAAHARGVTGLAVEELKTAFVTHLHSDHTAGYADLILTPWVLERKEPLTVFGPRGIKAMTRHLLKAYEEDIRIRARGLQPHTDDGWKVIANEIKPGVVYKQGSLTVTAFKVNHGEWPNAYGYRFETPERAIVISGDTAPCQTLIDNCKGCDVLVHEVYSSVGFATRPPEWRRYHSSYHTSAAQLAEIASEAKPRLLVLYHQLFWGTTDEALVQEIRGSYRGEVVSARDLDVY